MKQKIMGTGLSGLVGSRLVELLDHEYEFEDVSRKTGTDILNKEAVLQRIKASESEFVIHLAAYTNVDEAEKEKDLHEQSNAWIVNVEGTRNVIDAAEATGKHLLYISTDMVFPGDKPREERYTEDEATSPVGWYATTKAEAEKLVQASFVPWTIVRIAYPYRAEFEKKEYVRIFLSLLKEGKNIKAVSDHYFTPTFIDDLAKVFHGLLQTKQTGIFHAGGASSVSPYDVACTIAKVFALPVSLISETTREEFFQGKAPRAYNLSLSSDKIQRLGVQMKELEEGLEEIKRQLT